MTPLFAQINLWTTKPHIWGESDCLTVLADWVEYLHGIDPMKDVRLTYDDAGSCQRATGFFSDPVGVMGKYLDGIEGIERGNNLKVGDIAVLQIGAGKRDIAGGLWSGNSWVCKGESGAVDLSPSLVEVLAFWSMSYEG